MKSVPPSLQLQLLGRSFFLQASWSFEKMQGLGALYVVLPVLRHLYRDEELERACARHLSYFNTHPALAPLLLGGDVRIEADARDQAGAIESTEFRTIMMAPCAAMGDAFFWGGLRPLAAVAGLSLALKGIWFAPLVLLLVYNLPHLTLRSVGAIRGCRDGIGVIDFLERCRLPDLALRLKQGTLFALGALCGELAYSACRSDQTPLLWGWLFLPAVILLGWPVRRSISPLLLALLLTALILITDVYF